MSMHIIYSLIFRVCMTLTCTPIGANDCEIVALILQALKITLAESGGQIQAEGTPNFGGISRKGIRFLELLRRQSAA